MKIKSFLPSKIIACMECFGLYVTLVYLFVELKPEKHEAVIYLCFLYGVTVSYTHLTLPTTPYV